MLFFHLEKTGKKGGGKIWVLLSAQGVNIPHQILEEKGGEACLRTKKRREG